jgi:hypothetical protein
MTDIVSTAGVAIDEAYAHEDAATRRKFVAGAAGLMGSMGLLGLAGDAYAATGRSATHRRNHEGPNTAGNIVAVATTAEALATIINTLGANVAGLDAQTKANIEAAARHEYIHYQTLTSRAIGGKALTTRFWIPDAVFASREGLLGTLVVGDQVFINAYLLGATVFARPGGNASARLARIASEFMAVEMVHRALALQSLGKLGNDRAFAKFTQREEVEGLPTSGQRGFVNINKAVEILQAAGIGFGEEGSAPGRFYDLADVVASVPNPSAVNTRNPA